MRKMASSSPEGKVSITWERLGTTLYSKCTNSKRRRRIYLFARVQSLYQSWVLDSCRNILAILEDMPSLKPPVDHLCELLPRLQARYYSIASSSKVTIFLKCKIN